MRRVVVPMGDRNVQEWISDQLYTLLGETGPVVTRPARYTGALVCTVTKSVGRGLAVVIWNTQWVLCIAISRTLIQLANRCAGYSADAVTSYITALARKAPNVNALVNDLQSQVTSELRHILP